LSRLAAAVDRCSALDALTLPIIYDRPVSGERLPTAWPILRVAARPFSRKSTLRSRLSVPFPGRDSVRPSAPTICRPSSAHFVGRERSISSIDIAPVHLIRHFHSGESDLYLRTLELLKVI